MSEQRASLAMGIALLRLRVAATHIKERSPVGVVFDLPNGLNPALPGLFVRFDFPGIVRVFDAGTGKLLAESAPGQPNKLATGFCPPD